ncbi:MAG: tRNA (guanosine(46)-N7)-methyltransferase TrmB [Bacteroidales bacterium]|nr:tRNA (guanosine(46)-N7)-methyltransferase TrmB [Bacteroidales bacterium]
MGKNKLRRFAENETFGNLFQPSFSEVRENDHELKGNWHSHFFKNNNPIVLELGCGKGEYTVNLAKKYPAKNFIGIDIKGARLWKGAKEAFESNMENVAFIRNRIENINSFFSKDEVSEIWVTFPDPQPKKKNALKRLTSSRFLTYYQQFAIQNCIVHLKTDSQELHEYTKAVIEQNMLHTLECTNNLYDSELSNPALTIRTYYEQKFLEQGKPITYIKFELDSHKELKEPKLD